MNPWLNHRRPRYVLVEGNGVNDKAIRREDLKKNSKTRLMVTKFTNGEECDFCFDLFLFPANMSGTPATSCFTITPTDGSVPGTSQNVSSHRQYMFHGEIESMQSLVPVLKAICIKRTAIMAITERGLKISCEEDSKTVQANAFIERNLFRLYEMRDESKPETLCFRMSDLLSALSILFPASKSSSEDATFGLQRSSVLKLKYENADRLKLQVISGDHSAMAYIQTFVPINLVVFSMSFVNKIILDASVLIDFWKSVDTASTYLQMRIENDHPWFEMNTESDRGRFVYRITAQSIHVEHYECTVPLSNRYEMTAMHCTLRPLLLASKVSIRMDGNGLLNLQFLVRLDNLNRTNQPPPPAQQPLNASGQLSSQSSTGESQKCIIEFFIVPSLDCD